METVDRMALVKGRGMALLKGRGMGIEGPWTKPKMENSKCGPCFHAVSQDNPVRFRTDSYYANKS